MRLVEVRGGYLYQHRPDLFPHGHLTSEETALWCAYFEMLDERQKAAAGTARH